MNVKEAVTTAVKAALVVVVVEVVGVGAGRGCWG